MRYGSVCSGIEAATSAWHSLGWTPQWFSEIEPFPSAVLAHHYPNVPNFGDMTKFKEWKLDASTAIDVLVGGTPCQSFSVAGLRKGLDDPRGNLMLTYLAIARQYRPKWLVWENVPGVLSSSGGEDFASLLRGMGELGYGFAYRVLDAQYFGVAQRRRRVFVVGCLGDWRAAAAVLFERHSLSGHPAPSRKARKSPPGFFESSLAQYRQADVGGTLKASGGVLSGGSETFIKTQWPAEIAPTLNAKYGEKMGLENQHIDGGAGMFTLQPIALAENTIGRQPENGGNGDGFTVGGPMYTLNATGVHGVATNVGVVHGTQDPCVSDIAFAQGRNNGGENVLFSPMAVRRLTPIECERLQGFPDEYTNIPWRKKEESLDGPRYKALGNSMAVPVMHWIGKRISDAP
jgi:DNA (cytosine-5)-methyltransferase 1